MSFIICGTNASSNLVAVLPRPPPSDQFHTPPTRQPITCRPLFIGATYAVAGKDCPLLHLGNGTDMEVSQPRRQHGASN
jgi:hypothetical protein